MIDIHCHILPGIDDGARTFDDSIEMAIELAEQGVTDIVATPHYIDETNFVSSCTNNKKLYMELRKRLEKEGINVNLYLGNEIYITDRILDLLKAGKISALAGSKYLLVELPLDDEYSNFREYLRELRAARYYVVLAHPERYVIAQEDYGVLEELKEDGVLFQSNLGSIMGKYGKSAQKLAKRLMKDKMIFAFGSDMHRSGRKGYLTAAQKKLGKYYNEGELRQVLVTNPKKILAKG